MTGRSIRGIVAPMENKVTEIRKRQNLSREYVAYHAGISLRTLERIEKGHNGPRLENAIAIAGVLRCSLEEAFPGVAS